jgi:ketosteroid isomerase-like protein
MISKANESAGAAIKHAIETRNANMLSKLYTDDATLRVIDYNNPPSKPHEVRGRNAITTFWDDICGRAMTHKIDINATEGDRLTFSQSCTYPGGQGVLRCSGRTGRRKDRTSDHCAGLGRMIALSRKCEIPRIFRGANALS